MTHDKIESQRIVYHQTAQRLSEAMRLVAYDGTISLSTKMKMIEEIDKALPYLRRLMVMLQTEEINRPV